ncbi:phosphoesterase [Flavobacteriaceae bacterium R38]|nr:phosphoesterase [Flavobacteriaceae bacterium R38]
MKTKKITFLFFVIFVYSCAVYQPQYKNITSSETSKNKEISHEFYLIGDAGYGKAGPSTALNVLQDRLSKASKNSTTLFLGDNIYPSGLPEVGSEGRELAEKGLNQQIAIVKDYQGSPIFIPGNHDWYSNGLKGLKRQEKYIEEALGKNTFLPENGCPIEKVKINDEVVLLILDSEWFITDWDKHPTINDDCDNIKTREQFFEEVESQINKSQGKTLIIAMHHPLATNGSHGGNYSFGSNLKPLPVLGNLKNFIRRTGGVSPQDIQSMNYRTLSKRLLTLAQQSDNLIFVSGHEHSLQYIVNNNVPVIISGSGSKTTAASLGSDGLFAYGGKGFAKLVVYKDGSSWIRYYGEVNNYESPLFETEVIKPDVELKLKEYPNSFPSTYQSSVYTKEEISKGGLFRGLWGNHYREDYGRQITAKTVMLDTLFGGLTPMRKGGGHQSKSLRLKTKDGKEYVMRAVRKSAIRFLQAVAFKDQFIQEDYKDTYSEKLLLDFYTTAHPYAGLTVGEMADAIGVFHANPSLYFVPKQNALGIYNQSYGDELYYIEERVDSGHGDLKSFGYSNEIISTKDLLEKLREKDKNSVDERQYIRSRLFDMLIGDWDRHQDQWRWAEFDAGDGKKVYKPIPRDRDQVFSNFDGLLLSYATRVIPGLRLMQTYKPEMRNIKWFNDEPFPLDMAVLDEHNLNDWMEEAKNIQDKLTDEVIEHAFTNFPKEINQETLKKIKSALIGRRANLDEIAKEYYSHLKKYPIISGTDKDDWFQITRLAGGKTKVEAYRIKQGKKADKFIDVTYDRKETNQVWIYGLDDDDVFEVDGKGDQLIMVKIIGGQNNDIYRINNSRKVKVFDFKSKKNTFETPVAKRLSDSYDLNVYDYKKTKKTINQLLPSIGANPDDGLRIGLQNTLTVNSLNNNPFSQKHTIAAGYFFATEGFDIRYNGEFANVFGNWNFGIEGVYTSPNFAINFFGFGNRSINLDDDFDFDFNRVRILNIKAAPKLIWRGKQGAYFSVGGSYESIEVENTAGRFIGTLAAGVPNSVFDNQSFAGGELVYGFKNFNDRANPNLGMAFEIATGYKTNLDNSNSFGYLIPQLRFTSKIDPQGVVVFATKFKGHLNFGDGFEFYQGASIGGNNGLRGFRNQRFVGKNAYYQNTDLRFNLAKFKTGLFPMKFGMYGGFDYGRVWVEDDTSDRWHNSVGGGVFFNATNLVTANFAVFNSEDFNRFTFALGFNF